jgi:hypothetical protein
LTISVFDKFIVKKIIKIIKNDEISAAQVWLDQNFGRARKEQDGRRQRQFSQIKADKFSRHVTDGAAVSNQRQKYEVVRQNRTFPGKFRSLHDICHK